MSKFENWLYNKEEAHKQLRIATTAMQSDWDPVETRKRISNMVSQIITGNPDVEIILFGEMITGWYDPKSMAAYHKDISETIPGQTTDLLAKLSKKHKIYLCFGISEKKKGEYYNTQVLVDPQGEIRTTHRKWNLKPGEREAGYKPGPDPVTKTETKGLKVGMITCSDAAHQRTIRDLVQSDLDLILYSLADDKDENWFMAKTLARLFDSWIVSANRFGEENRYWNGHTFISDPLGKLQELSVDREGYLVHTIRVAEDRSKFLRLIRRVFVKTPLFFHLIKNWETLKSYFQ